VKASESGRMAMGEDSGATGNNVALGSDSGWIGEGEWRCRAGQIGKGEPARG
jgi:hypothetical protein